MLNALPVFLCRSAETVLLTAFATGVSRHSYVIAKMWGRFVTTIEMTI